MTDTPALTAESDERYTPWERQVLADLAAARRECDGLRAERDLARRTWAVFLDGLADHHGEDHRIVVDEDGESGVLFLWCHGCDTDVSPTAWFLGGSAAIAPEEAPNQHLAIEAAALTRDHARCEALRERGEEVARAWLAAHPEYLANVLEDGNRPDGCTHYCEQGHYSGDDMVMMEQDAYGRGFGDGSTGKPRFTSLESGPRDHARETALREATHRLIEAIETTGLHEHDDGQGGIDLCLPISDIRSALHGACEAAGHEPARPDGVRPFCRWCGVALAIPAAGDGG